MTWTIFTVVLTFIALCVSGVITVRLTATTNLSTLGRWCIAALIALIFMSPFLLRAQTSSLEGLTYNTIAYVTYFCFVCVFLFFCLMIGRDVIWFILKHVCPMIPSPFQAQAVLRANAILGVIVVILSAYSLYEGTRVPRVREVTLTSDKITKPLKIVSLPDIHIHRALSARKLKGIIEVTNAIKPDIIALPGDIIDDRADKIRDLVTLLGDLKAPLGIYVTDGNHEIYVGTQNTTPQFQAEKLTYLNNAFHQVRSDVVVAGVPDIQSTQIYRPPNMKEALPTTDAYTILLAHSPKMFDMRGNTADLQLSGHTHGGQIFPFHILTKWSNGYLAGLYTDKNRTLYVSRGAGQWGPQMRLLAPSEITVITVLPK